MNTDATKILLEDGPAAGKLVDAGRAVGGEVRVEMAVRPPEAIDPRLLKPDAVFKPLPIRSRVALYWLVPDGKSAKFAGWAD